MLALAAPVRAQSAPAPPLDEASPEPASPDDERWCAPELAVLDGDVCVAPAGKGSLRASTLVIFLHGVIKPGTRWQWNQQRGAARAAATHGFTVVMPRGRQGHGPRGMEDWITWPTGAAGQAADEASELAEWARARRILEAMQGHAFERVWVFGFSNGAYYTTSLAMRDRLGGEAALRADGFAAFAGGSGAPYLQKLARQTRHRPPFFVAWGGRDRDHGDQQKLARMLRAVGWPSRSEEARKAGHVMTDHQVQAAVRFLDAARPTR